MKFNFNLITLALLANTGIAIAADGYGLANANTDKVKLSAWRCKACVVDTGVSGTLGAGVGFQDSNDIRSANAFGSANDVLGKVDADLRYRGDNGYQATVDATNLGMDGGRLAVKAGQQGHYALTLDYRQIATYKTDKALSPYQGIGSDNLTLADDWVTAGSSNQMPMLYSSLSPLELSLKRERTGLGVEYQGESLWSSYVHYQREAKSGLKQTSGSFFNQSMMLAEPVDYTTDTIEAGIKLKGANWFTALNYNGSIFKNEYNQLHFDSAFNPTFGAQTSGSIALSPDNQSHIVSLLGQYNDSRTVVTGKMLFGQMTQDQAFVTSGYGYALASESLDGKVDMTGMNLKAVTKLSRSLRVSGSYDYTDRDNKTQVEQWTQISINTVNGQAAYNTPYDSTHQKLKLEADYRLSRGLKLDGGYEFKRDERNYQDRESTDENTLWARFRISRFDTWDIWVKGSYGERGGSQYQASEWTSSESNSLLRKYNLADRNRTLIEARVTHSPLDNLTIDFGARYALDDYDETQIGLTESKDNSYDASISYLLTQDLTLNAFYNYQTIASEQAGSSNFNTATWLGTVEDEVDVLGAGLNYHNLLEQKLQLGLDYTYSDSNSNTQVRQGISGDYGDYFAKVHNLNAYAQYQATEKMALRLDYKYEKYQDNDAANDIAVDGIWNLVSFGSNSHDYNAHFIMLSMNYRL